MAIFERSKFDFFSSFAYVALYVDNDVARILFEIYFTYPQVGNHDEVVNIVGFLLTYINTLNMW